MARKLGDIVRAVMDAAPRPTVLLRSIPVIGLLLAACSPGSIGKAPDLAGPTPGAAAAHQAEPPTPISGPSTGCYYSWATRELPELTTTFRAQLKAIDPGNQGSAYAFGEDCRTEDGVTTFLPMETDYRARIPVVNLADEAALGGWVRRVVEIVEDLPASLVVGTRAGRIDFEFQGDDSEILRMSVEISRYRTEASGLDDSAIFHHFR